jgi:dCMP deaminase
MIIGLTGSLASGKGIVSDFLKEKSFVYLSLSNELRQVASEKGIEINRKNLQDLGNYLRKENGSGVLAELVVKKIIQNNYKNVVIDGIRNPKEIEVLRKLKNFYLISVDANVDIRFERMKKRNRENDPKTWEEFLQVDSRDKGIGEEASGQNVAKCMEQSDFFIMNNLDLNSTKKRVEEIYNLLLKEKPRPSWDEYFMKMASLVAERSTCIRHHVGAVIVKDKRLMTTGYNGAAIGVESCLSKGCLRNELGIASGTRHEICRAIHAEQNAIIQAGRHGINIKDSVLYCTHTPCMICAKMIVNAGIKEIVSYQDYPDESAKKFLSEAGVLLRKVFRPENDIEFLD